RGTERASFNPVNFLSFFTIESNILAAIVLLAAGSFALCGKQSARLDMLRGAAFLYMTITGIVYTLLLSGQEESLQTAIPWVNSVVHYIMPAVVFADWFITPPVKRISFKAACFWLIFPILYLAYSLIRGPIVQWYPYPFLDPAGHGYGGIAVVGIGIMACALALVAVGSWSTRRAKPAQKKR
ncbi:MAG TPA: Pr6Pr family membrane protein, partial [Candidatus Saccharimonadales bacterium]|nr:Pr6Pr family membrane protein [Candidatus Saccharimonadales bacterium]